MKDSTPRIPCLDGLRAASILLVILGHGLSTTTIHIRWLLAFMPIFTNSVAGVTIFFVISGYLITTLLCAEWQQTRSIDMSGFYLRRVLRIFPAFYAYILVIAVLAGFGILTVGHNQFVSAVTFLWNYRHLWNHLNDDAVWFLGQFWTLSLEEQFYLLWPLVLLLCTPVRAASVALALILVSPLLRVATYVMWPAARGQIGLMLHTASDSLMFGCLAALWQGSPRFEAVWEKIERAGVSVPVAVASFLLLVSPYLRMAFRGAYQITVGTTLEASAITILMLWLVRHSDSTVGSILQRRFIVHVGVLSYSLYVWQQLFLTPLNRTWTGSFPINYLVAFTVAEVSYHCLERPFLRLRRRTVFPLKNDVMP